MKLHQPTDLGSEKCWVPIGQSYSRCCRSATLPRSRARGSGTRVQKTWRKWKTWRREMANLQFQRLGKSALLPKDVLIQTVFESFFLYGRAFPTCGCPGGQERKEAESRKSKEVVGIYESREASISSAYIQGIKSLQSESSYKCPNCCWRVSMFCQPRIQLELGRWEIMETCSEFGMTACAPCWGWIIWIQVWQCHWHIAFKVFAGFKHRAAGKATDFQETRGIKYVATILETWHHFSLRTTWCKAMMSISHQCWEEMTPYATSKNESVT